MSNDYFYRKWKKLLTTLDELVNLDFEYQRSKAHSKDLCLTVHRLSNVLGGYSAVYNDGIDCLQNTTQVQKIKYISDIVVAISQRIIELKHQLSKLEKSNYQFIARGVTDLKLTTADAELKEIPKKIVRPPHVQEIIEGVLRQAREIREKEESIEEVPEKVEDLWKEEVKEDTSIVIVEKKEELTEEQRQRRDFLNLIIAQEKCRQVIQIMKHQRLKREMWEKQLYGTAKPEAELEIKTRAAMIIQKFARAFCEIKRKRIRDCMLDEKLGIRMCRKLRVDATKLTEEINKIRADMQQKYENERKIVYNNAETKFKIWKMDGTKEDYRDEIRDWFWKWYKKAWFFYDIPNENQGGSTLILLGETPEPGVWLEENQNYMERMKSNKGKSSSELKEEKKAAKRAELLLKKEEQMKVKREKQMLEKMSKNPKMHPGFNYPMSTETENVRKALQNYHTYWDYIDNFEKDKAKTKFIPEIEENDAINNIKRQIRTEVDVDMRVELKTLKTALKSEYATFEKEMPITMPETFRKLSKKMKVVKEAFTEAVTKKMLDLAVRGIVKEYPRTKFEDFKGEANYAGDDQRCNYVYAMPFGAETRRLWWDRCRELTCGFRKLLLVGPKSSGKTMLVHCMATVNDAVLFELDPVQLNEESTENLQELVNLVAVCAKAAQPSVVYLKHIHRLFYTKKKPPGEPNLNKDLLNKYLIKKLSKKFGTADKIAIIGSCIDPWLTNSNQLIKQFPSVFLMPNTTYTTTRLLLGEWVLKSIPPDFDISSLAYVLQGYSFGFLKRALENFMSPARIVRMTAYGLRPQELFDFVANEEGGETKVEYNLYLDWYSEKTQWGALEKQHLVEQKEFQEALKKIAEKENRNKSVKSAASSVASFF